jgi:hypothetical protein
MTHLTKLALVPLNRGFPVSPAEHRRIKLLAKLDEQLGVAQSQIEGRRYTVSKVSWTRDNQGKKTRSQSDKSIRPWWWKEGDGVTMVVRYGARPLELAKGMKAIRIASINAIPDVINTIIDAVKGGELDGAIDAALAGIKPRGKRRKVSPDLR